MNAPINDDDCVELRSLFSLNGKGTLGEKYKK